MNILRTDLQTALNDLHVAVQESADHYRDAAEFIDDPAAAELFTTIAGERDSLEKALADAVRDTGDLPAGPDSEKEAGEQLIHRLRTLFASDQAADVIRQRLDSETQLERVADEGRALEPGEPYTALSERCRRQVDSARQRLEQALAEQS